MTPELERGVSFKSIFAEIEAIEREIRPAAERDGYWVSCCTRDRLTELRLRLDRAVFLGVGEIQ